MVLTGLGERSVSLVLRVKIDGRWTRFPAAYGKNGRIRPGFAQVGEKQIQFESPAYETRIYENRQAKYTAVGRNAADAEAERQRLEKGFVARAMADRAGLKIEKTPDVRPTLKQSAADYIKDCQDRDAMEAAGKARLVTDEFLKIIKKTYVDEIQRGDILAFHKALRKHGMSDRTIFDKHNRIKSWMIFAKVNKEALKDILPPTPKFDKKLPTTYTRDEVTAILEAAPPKERLTYEIAMKCGLRDQELCHLEYRDIDHERKVLRVRSKPKHEFRVKDSEERDVPVPYDLLAAIQKRRAEYPDVDLVLPSARGGVDRKMLRTLKRLAKAHDLNCGQCEGCASELGECQAWTLHKFRRTYATTLLRNQVDLKTVQHYMGHADLASTLRYLRPAEGEEARERINAIQW